ncbi:histone chaperone domain CHZ-domain-containing protein [Thermothelomyces heterothallicus CBS 202.75]|uniref:histone chaperone domain CHZ-domain-containing protein n=1 Tax=Thermothelomyces heterothallicus CBS 202.75 TaxID=1149848 RepID=UPI003743FFDB
MKLPVLLTSILTGAVTLALASDGESTHTAAVFIQRLSSPTTPPALLAELAIPDSFPRSATGEDGSPIASEVLSYSAPELPDDDSTNLVRIGIYDPFSHAWVSSTSVASAANFAKGYAPHFVLSVDAEGRYLGVTCRGVAIDAGVTRDFGPQAVVVRTAAGKQPVLGKPVVLSPEGRKVGQGEEKTFLQKYWWVLAIGVINIRKTTPIANMSTQNGSDETTGVTSPENGAAPATDSKGKGKAPATEEPEQDTSMVEDDDDDDDDDEEAEPEPADEDNLEEIDLDNVIGRRTRGKVIDFAKAAAENPPEDDEDEEDDEDFVADDGKMDED